jgi:hypothetical protein
MNSASSSNSSSEKFRILIICSTVYAYPVYVNGYFMKDGTYVNGYWRSSPDALYFNNYRYHGNINPFTGEVGTNYNYNSINYDYLYKNWNSNIKSYYNPGW